MFILFGCVVYLHDRIELFYSSDTFTVKFQFKIKM